MRDDVRVFVKVTGGLPVGDAVHVPVIGLTLVVCEALGSLVTVPLAGRLGETVPEAVVEAVLVPVEVGVPVPDAVDVAVDVSVCVGEPVPVGLGVSVRLGVPVAVLDAVELRERVAETEAVGGGVGSEVLLEVPLLVAVPVRVDVPEAVAVAEEVPDAVWVMAAVWEAVPLLVRVLLPEVVEVADVVGLREAVAEEVAVDDRVEEGVRGRPAHKICAGVDKGAALGAAAGRSIAGAR